MLRKTAVAIPFFLSKIKLCAVNTAKVREWYFTFFEKFVFCIVPYSLDTSSLEMYVKFTNLIFLLYKLVIVIVGN